MLAWKAMVRLLTLSGLILLLAAPPASAGVREKILRECQNGRITGNYTPGQLRDARRNIPTDLDEYSDCRDVLSRASLAGRGSGDGGGGTPDQGGGTATGGATSGGGEAGGGDEILSAGDQREKDALGDARTSAAAVTVDGERILPGFAAKAARHGLPAPVVVVLVLLGLCALALTLPSVRRRVRARRATE